MFVLGRCLSKNICKALSIDIEKTKVSKVGIEFDDKSLVVISVDCLLTPDQFQEIAKLMKEEGRGVDGKVKG
jgi:hypothetical protein